MSIIDLRASDSLNYFQTIKYDFISAFKDYSQMFSDYKPLSTKSLFTYSTFAAGVGAAYSFDNDIRLKAESRSTIDLFKQAGQSYTALGVPSIVYAYGLFFKDEDVRITGRLLFEAMALSGLANISMKYIIGRARPFMEKGKGDFEFFEPSNGYQSFPSGHTTVAFTLATVLAERIDTWWAYAGFYSIAALTGYERIHSDNHWFSDVVGGALLGYFCSQAVLTAYNTRENKEKSSSFNYIIMPNINGLALSLNYRF